MNEWYISLDSDNADVDKLRDWYSFVSAPLPEVKTNYVETQSAVVPTRDITDAGGISIYDNRQVTLTVIKRDVSTKGGLDGVADAESYFVNKYYGKRVRIIQASSGRFYCGRLDAIEPERAKGNRNSVKLVCGVTADPAFYDAEYTVVDTDAINKVKSGENKPVDNVNIVRKTIDNVVKTTSEKTSFTMATSGETGGVTTGYIVIRVPSKKQIRIRSVSTTNLTYDMYEYDNVDDYIGERIGRQTIISNETSGYLYYAFYVKLSDETKQGKISFKIDTLSPVTIINDGLPVVAQYGRNLIGGGEDEFSGVSLVANNHSITPQITADILEPILDENYVSHPVMVIKSGKNYFSAYPTVYSSAKNAEGTLLVRYRRGALL